MRTCTWIPLSQGKHAVIDLADAPRVRQHTWWAIREGNNWYAYTQVGRRSIRLHQFILSVKSDIDHRNHQGLDCRRENLRPCTHQENMRNRKKNPVRKNKNSSIYKGVCRCHRTGRWRAYITVSGKASALGSYATEWEAAEAYNTAAVREFGEFAYLNERIDAHG